MKLAPMKALAKKALKWAFRHIPWGGREAIFEAYCEDQGRFSMIAQNASSFHIVALKIAGEYGIIQGSPYDHAVLATYGKSGRWAERTNNLIQDFFDSAGGGTYLDIGANIGLTTIPIGQNPNVQCFAFEAEPNNFENLTANIEANCLHGNVVARQIAVFDRRSTLTLELSPTNLGDHRLRLGSTVAKLGENEWSTVDVEAAPLDELVTNLSSPLAVKVDTQGAEPFVVAGGKKTLARADLLIMEFSPYWMARMGSDPKVVVDLVRTFPRVTICKGESGSFSPTISGIEASCQLLEIEKDNRDIAVGAYWDVIARM